MSTAGLKYYLVRDKQNYGPYTKAELSQYVKQRSVSLAEFCREAIPDGSFHRVGNLLEDGRAFGEPPSSSGNGDEIKWELGSHDIMGEDEERHFDDSSTLIDSWEEPGAYPWVQTFSGLTVPNLARMEAVRTGRNHDHNEASYEGHPSLWHYTPNFFWTAFWLVTGLSLWQLSPGFPFFGSAIATWNLFVTALDYEHRRYLIDHRRIEITEGVFRRSSREILIKDIRDTQVVQKGFFQSVFKLGDIIFNSSMGKNAIHFKAVKNPQQIKGLIRDIQAQTQAKRFESAMDSYSPHGNNG